MGCKRSEEQNRRLDSDLVSKWNLVKYVIYYKQYAILNYVWAREVLPEPVGVVDVHNPQQDAEGGRKVGS